LALEDGLVQVLVGDKMKKQMVIIGIIVLLVSIGLSGCAGISTITTDLGVHFKVRDFDVVFTQLRYENFKPSYDSKTAIIDVKITNSYGKQESSICITALRVEVNGGYFYDFPGNLMSPISGGFVFGNLKPFASTSDELQVSIPLNKTIVKVYLQHEAYIGSSLPLKRDGYYEPVPIIVNVPVSNYSENNDDFEKFIGAWKSETTEILSTFNSDGTYITGGVTYDWSITYSNYIVVIGGTEYTYIFSNYNQTLTLHNIDKGTTLVYIKQ
jgi:hypothetical protein